MYHSFVASVGATGCFVSGGISLTSKTSTLGTEIPRYSSAFLSSSEVLAADETFSMALPRDGTFRIEGGGSIDLNFYIATPAAVPFISPSRMIV